MPGMRRNVYHYPLRLVKHVRWWTILDPECTRLAVSAGIS